MAELPPVPSVLRMQFRHTYGGIPSWVHWFFKYAGTGPSVTDAAAIANAAKNAWVSNLASLAHSSVVLTLVNVTDLTSATSAQNNSSGTAPGTRVGTALTSNDAV